MAHGSILPWRAASTADLDAIMLIQADVHPLMQEREEVLANKLGLFPEGCRVLVQGAATVAYAIGHPYILDAVPPLDVAIDALPDAPNCLFIHDVALLSPARGKGAGRAYVNAMTSLAAALGLQALALVSVYDSYRIWEKCGFRIRPLHGLADKFGPFGATAHYMTAPLV